MPSRILLWPSLIKYIFQNDLSVYADDQQLYSSGHASEVERTLTDQAQATSNWYTDIFLMVNKEKFKVLLLPAQTFVFGIAGSETT